MLPLQRHLFSALICCVAVLALGCAGGLEHFIDPDGATPSNADSLPGGDTQPTAPEENRPQDEAPDDLLGQPPSTPDTKDDAGAASAPQYADGGGGGGQQGGASSKDGATSGDISPSPGDGAVLSEADGTGGAGDAGSLPNGKPKPGTR